MTLQLHKPDGEGGIEPRITDPRTGATSSAPRAGAQARAQRLPALRNPEMNPTSRFMSVLFWLGLGALTFVLLVLGYATGFWP